MRVLLTGSSGQLGGHLTARLVRGGHEVVAWSGQATGTRAGVVLRPVDLTDLAVLERAMSEADPAVVVHTAAVSAIDAVRLDPARGRAVNVTATGFLADWCGRRGRRIVYTSTDLVFDGRKGWYREDDPAAPVMLYGQTKLEAEPAVLAVPGGVVARTSLLYGPARGGKATYFDRTNAALARGEVQTFFDDEFRTPLDLATAAEALMRLAVGDLAGLVHLGGPERTSRHELSCRVAAALGFDPGLVRANHQADVAFPEPRPADVSLDTGRLSAWLPDLPRPVIEDAVRMMIS